MSYRLLLISSIALIGTGGLAIGADNQLDRYTMAPADGGGFVRLDTQTGAMAFCDPEGTGWSCRAMPDATRDASEQIAALRAENKYLKDEIKRMEDTFGLNGNQAQGDGQGPPPAPPSFKVPSEQDVDKALDYVERMIKKFRDRLQKLEKETKPQPDTTPL